MPKQEMLINDVPGEECRIAIVENGLLEELYHERPDADSQVGNIYKGRVVNVEPAIQAAFVDFGKERNGFLHISDLHPKYFGGSPSEQIENVGNRTARRDRPLIQKCLKRNQEVLVQVLKDGIGTKGPTLSSYLSIPGRFLVMMPDMHRLGVSRKIEDDELRRTMRRMLDELDPPKEFGFIIRTAGLDRTKTDLKRDLAYLQRLWKAIERRMQTTEIGELYTESDLVVRTIRDVYTADVQRIIVDEPAAARRAAEFLAIASPRSGSEVYYYSDSVPLFHRYDVERQIELIHAKVVPLPSGGSLVIESTEALVAIDVNSGRMRDNRDAETTAYKTNQEAADEICRQLRLRDLGGVVVNDLIDMRDSKHRRAIESRFRDNLKRDRARKRVLPISQFGILEMTRQRMRPSLGSSVFAECRHCRGAGEVKRCESVAMDVLRRLSLVLYRKDVARVELAVSPDVAFELLNRKRSQIVAIEQRHDKPVMVRVHQNALIDTVQVTAYDARGGLLDIDKPAEGLGQPTLQRVEPGQPIGQAEDEAEAADQTDSTSEKSDRAPAAGVAGRRKSVRRPRRRSKAGPVAVADKPKIADKAKIAAKAPEPSKPAAEPTPDAAAAAKTTKPRRRRRGGRGRGGKKKAASQTAGQDPSATTGSGYRNVVLQTAGKGDGSA